MRHAQGYEITTASARIAFAIRPRDQYATGDNVYTLRFGKVCKQKYYSDQHFSTLLFEVDSDDAVVRDFCALHRLHVAEERLRGHLLMLMAFGDTLRVDAKGRADADMRVGIARYSMAIVCARLRNRASLMAAVRHVASQREQILRKSLQDGFVPYRCLLIISQYDHARYASLYGQHAPVSVVGTNDCIQVAKDAVGACWQITAFTDGEVRAVSAHSTI